MNKTVLSVILISWAFLCFVASPVKAEKKRLKLEELKACAQESAAFPSLLEEYDKVRKRINSLNKKADMLYNKVESEKSKLDKMNAKSQEEIDRYNELVEKINEQAIWQRKVVEKVQLAVTKQNVLKAEIEKRGADYNDTCTNVFFEEKHFRMVCEKKGVYKDTDFCKEMKF